MKKTSNKLSALGEFGLIHQIQKKAFFSKSVIKGIGDDTAVLPYDKSNYLLLTTDMMVEGVHFTKKMNPVLIGHKALACNISDIAAMGGVPQHAVVSLGVPKTLSVQFIQKIYDGINRLAKKYRVSIVGGDTVKSDKIIINIALTGLVKKNHLTLRSGARKGDVIVVTGALGGSFKSGHHLSFTPRVAQSQYLVNHVKLSSMIDISDGLASDLGHILSQSNVDAFLFENKIPVRSQASLQQALTDGEDFELCFTLSAKAAEKLFKLKHGFKFFPIGRITEKKKGFTLIDRHGKIKPISMKGFVHF